MSGVRAGASFLAFRSIDRPAVCVAYSTTPSSSSSSSSSSHSPSSSSSSSCSSSSRARHEPRLCCTSYTLHAYASDPTPPPRALAWEETKEGLDHELRYGMFGDAEADITVLTDHDRIDVALRLRVVADLLYNWGSSSPLLPRPMPACFLLVLHDTAGSTRRVL
ncbi:hypothetical protein BZA05DRAFT_247495 [Tricharina praecox]|uniref:uncharacterized protein n=1 Tax=Tricharina praecox TaxID=43433 RepID=UPI00221FC227|nr:uncharacterized protein BZA05DRAFT_247495 [Tricharina praecox]KAI5854675.1 hypothetical protein BZA05DRAFT_247495 [Tricharina praecox]